jgi:hypothetical protein
MVVLKNGCFFLFLIWILSGSAQVLAQPLSNVKQRYIATNSDSVTFDSLSVVPGSLTVYFRDGSKVPDSLYKYKEPNPVIGFPKNHQLPDSILLVYRTFPLLLNKPFRNRDRSVIEKNYAGLYNPFSYGETTGDPGFFKLEGLQRNGNISRGVSFGNNQDLVVNSSFNLQLSGKLNDDVEILAAITDNNIPVQPEGNTQQIQDFDKVFIQLSKNQSKLIAGDFELKRPDSYFMNFYKKGQGAVFSSVYNPFPDTTKYMRTTVSGAISKGKYARNIINGVEANQGPYRLNGAENETFIIVLSGTEKVFVDGVEMVRGEQYDYVIDYNTAEVTFTTRRPITKDKRIVVEFQYSDKNYSRTMLFANQEYQDKKWSVKANIFSEQDAKNQPLLQDLDEEAKLLLAAAGDSIQQAFYPGVDSVAFNSTEVLYAQRDSSGFTYFEYSTDSTEAFYRLRFSVVGANKGNYIPIAASANGRVFQFVFPINNIPQGSYEPVVLLVAPKQQQLITVGAGYNITSNSSVFVETAWSNNNVNLFSSKDKADDTGFAFRGGASLLSKLSSDSLNGWKLRSAIKLEHVNKYFKPIENFRAVEFSRDWNLGTAALVGDENAADLSLQFEKPKQLLNYQLKTFLKGDDYQGLMNVLSSNVNFLKFNLITNSSYLISKSPLTDTRFLRSVFDVSRPVWRLIAGVRLEQEHNVLTDVASDSIRLNSFLYDQRKIYFTSNDTSKTFFRIDFSRRYDYAVAGNYLKKSTVADEASARIDFLGNPKSRLSISSSYRNLAVRDSQLTAIPPEESFLNRMEYNATIWKGFITSTTFFEAGTGQELKKEYAYVEVTPGTGVYTYAGDYNGNGVKDLDEFEIAAFSDQANFIKVFLPTNEYVKTRTNQFNQVLTINPAAWFIETKGWRSFVARFSNQVSYRIDNKTLEKDVLKALNPFDANIDDSLLVTSNAAFRNTLSFNRNSTVFGLDATLQSNTSKSFLTNGFESRVLQSLVNNFRWNINRIFSLQATTENGTRKSASEFFSNRDYEIEFYSLEPKFSIQPGLSFRTSLTYEFKNKQNVAPNATEKSDQHDGGIELKFSSVKKGVATAKFNVIIIDYNAPENTPIAYEILEGLKKGTNYTWGLSLQRNLSNSIQLNLNYEGRKPQGTNIIHTGGVQARAFF